MTQLTLGDLIASEGRPKLALVSGGQAALLRPVRGVHSTEMEHPAMWVEREWVVLTSGLNLKRHPEKQRQLVHELDEAGVTALGFGVGSAFSVVPQALREAAVCADFPVFSIPWSVSFRDMIRDVYQALLSDDIRVYQRLVAMQNYLLDALADESPQEAVLGRLASLTEATAAIVAPGGRVLAATGSLPMGEIWRELSERSLMITELQVSECACVCVPLVQGAEAPARWLVVGSSKQFANLARRIVQVTAPLLSAMNRIDAAAHDQERRLKASLLEALLEGGSGLDERGWAARARQWGIDCSADARVMVVAGITPDPDGSSPLEAAECVLDSLGAAGLIVAGEEGLQALVEPRDKESWREVVDAIAARFPGARLGVGRRLSSLDDARRSHHDALLVMRSLQGGAANAEDGMVFYEGLDLDAMLIGEVPRERWDAKAAELLEPLATHPELRLTLFTYFDAELDAVEAAAQLHLHPNSLRYRLRRVEELLGRSLRHPSTIASLQLARLGLGTSPRPCVSNQERT